MSLSDDTVTSLTDAVHLSKKDNLSWTPSSAWVVIGAEGEEGHSSGTGGEPLNTRTQESEATQKTLAETSMPDDSWLHTEREKKIISVLQQKNII